MKIGITLGDPSSISPEILVKSYRKLPKATYIIYGSEDPIKKASSITGLRIPYKLINYPEDTDRDGFYLIPVLDEEFIPGKPNFRSGKASVIYLEMAVDHILAKKIDALITLPVSKKHIMASGFKFAGHTDYLAYRSGVKNYIMMLVCQKMKVALATTHIPIKDIPKELHKANLKEMIKLLNKEMIKKFKVKNPKIAVLGLNPHAGDGGNIGKEEIEIIQPSVDLLRKEGIDLTDPLPPDTAFLDPSKYDVYFAMYHDQGLIPLKMVCFKKAVNITLGLPFIRTSPDHGTGFDIAGKGKADPSSFIEAVKTAIFLLKQD
ncbi:4-hydroxythreonine-4-phosphate dehydrogenase PdxA [Persephonella sp.]